MWEEKMTQEEDDLEEELSSLDIREDHGEEDSDVTPINTPPSTPPILYIKKYPPVKPPQNEEKQNFHRFSRAEDYDCRSESSLSWGDDEFEGEATKQVSLLFDQVDLLLYKEEKDGSKLGSDSGFESPFYNEDICNLDDNTQKVSLVDTPLSIEEIDENSTGTRKFSYGYSSEEYYGGENIQSPEKIFNYGRFMDSSAGKFSVDQVVVSDPTPELQEESSNWVQQFPHFRVRGLSVCSSELQEPDNILSSDEVFPGDNDDEEIMASDGDFEHLLPLVCYSSANQIKNVPKDALKRVTSSSRVCSGSNDPEVLKEQVLILLFEKLWDTVTKTVEPLLYQYARYIIEQSVQYLSISREPSTRGSRLSARRISQKDHDKVNVNSKYLLPSHLVHRPFSGTNNLTNRGNRPISSIRRSSSAVYRLQNNIAVPDIQQEELRELLQVSAKPIQNGEDRLRSSTLSMPQSRISSAMSCTSQVSFPVVTTPRDYIQRPVSSKSTSHHLASMKTSSYANSGEQRPASTSSFNARMRFQEKFQNQNRQGTIQELGNDNAGSEIEDDTLEQRSPVWSRHIPFLPPIADSGGTPLKVQQMPAMNREDKMQPMLCVKGTVMSATHRSDAHPRSSRTPWGIPIIESAGPTKQSFADKK